MFNQHSLSLLFFAHFSCYNSNALQEDILHSNIPKKITTMVSQGAESLDVPIFKVKNQQT